MSRSIADSVNLLTETLGNCKTNLKEKGVEADTIKISDVDEKIAEIQAGGGSSNEIDLSETGYDKCIIVFVPTGISATDYTRASIRIESESYPHESPSAVVDNDFYYVGIITPDTSESKIRVHMHGSSDEYGSCDTDWVEVDISSPKLIFIENDSCSYSD